MTMPPGVYLGCAVDDGKELEGWTIGKFITSASLHHSRAVEVKFSHHRELYCEEGSTANWAATGLSVNISGAFTYLFREGEQDEWYPCTLSERGQYVIWLPGVFHSLCVHRSCEMLVVRWPSVGWSDKTSGAKPSIRGHND
jgi:hypothetical protein